MVHGLQAQRLLLHQGHHGLAQLGRVVGAGAQHQAGVGGAEEVRQGPGRIAGAVQHALRVGQGRLGGLQLGVAALQQLVGQRGLDLVHGVHAQGAGVKPDFAQLHVQRGVGGRGAADAAQPLDGGQVGAVHAGGLPQGQRGGGGAFGKDLQAALLRVDQVQPVLLAGGGAGAAAEDRGAGGAFLAGQLLALHEVQHGNQQARDVGVGGTVGGLEDHGQQAGDQADVGLGGGIGAEVQRGDAGAQRRQRIQPLQHIGNVVAQARAMAAAQRLQVQRIQHAAQRACAVRAGLDLGVQGLAGALAVAGQQDVGQAALFLQRMDQLAQLAHQGAGALQPVQFVNFALPGGNQVVQGSGHGGHGRASVPAAMQIACRPAAAARAGLRACP